MSSSNSKMSKWADKATKKMKGFVIKLLDPSELFNRENILEDFNLDETGRSALRDNLNGYKRAFIMENIKYFCLAICPAVPNSARAFGQQMLEFKKSLEEDIKFKRILIKIEQLNDNLNDSHDSVIEEIQNLRNTIKPEFLKEETINSKSLEKKRMKRGQTVVSALATTKNINDSELFSNATKQSSTDDIINNIDILMDEGTPGKTLNRGQGLRDLSDIDMDENQDMDVGQNDLRGLKRPPIPDVITRGALKKKKRKSKGKSKGKRVKSKNKRTKKKTKRS